MDIGLLRERRGHEWRVGFTPAGVKCLVDLKHRVYVEKGAGEGGGFSDEDYREVGATVSYSRSEVIGRGRMLLKVLPVMEDEIGELQEEQILVGFMKFAMSTPRSFEVLSEKRCTVIGYEAIRDEDGSAPILKAMSEIGGQLSVHLAQRHLLSSSGGRGVLLGGLPGVAPAVFVVLGAGTAGFNVAKAALNLGAQVVLLDKDIEKLRKAGELLGSGVTTLYASVFNIDRALKFADIVVGAVAVPGERAPLLVSRERVKQMRPNTLIIDLSIDQGGCFETSRPTDFESPTYVEEGTVHCCIPNLPSNVSRTSTYALTNATLPFVREIAESGIAEALRRNGSLAKGVLLYEGKVTNEAVARYIGVECFPVEKLIGS